MTDTPLTIPKRTIGSQPLIAGLGEILWDIFPENTRLGGAPGNFAIHCKQMGATSHPVSAIGNDVLGNQTLEDLGKMGINTSYIQRQNKAHTGTVSIHLDTEGKPSYQIAEGAAWDQIALTPNLLQLASKIDAVCFGSLAQRSPISRETIHTFLITTRPEALRIFDINLREKFFSKELVDKSLQIANILKISDEELPIVAKYFDLKGDTLTQLETLREMYGLRLIAYTRGGDGSILCSAKEIDESCGKDITVVDSVGAGDSFTAAMCTGILNKWPLSKVNQIANEVAAFVCSQKGATPEFPAKLIERLSASKP